MNRNRPAGQPVAQPLELLFGRLTGVYRTTMGHPLTAAADVGQTVLSVLDTADFDEAGGQVLVSEVLYDYDTVDPEASTITLATPLTEPAAVDDPVEVYAPEDGTITVGYEANVVLDDQDPTDRPIQVDVPHGLVQMLDEATRGGSAESVTLVRDGEHDWTIWQIDGKLAVDLALEAAKADIGVSLQDLYDRADENAAAAAEAALNGTAAMVAANGKNKVTYSASGPGVTANTAGDIWWQRSGGLIAAQWVGLGGTSWQSATLAGAVIAYLDAGQLTAGSAFVNALSVKTNFTLGDASTNGVIQSYNFAGSDVGVYIDKFGLVAKGGSITSAAIYGSYFENAHVIVSNDDVKAYTELGHTGPYAMLSGSAKSLGVGGFKPGILVNDGVGFLRLYGAGGDWNMDGDLNIAGSLSVSGSFPAAWVGSATSALDMNAHDITDAGEVRGTALFASGPGSGSGIPNVRYALSASGGELRYTDHPNSSERFKKNIEDLDVDPEAAYGLRPVRFEWRDEHRSPDRPEGYVDMGFIAEELQALGFERWLGFDEDGLPSEVDYAKVTVIQQVAIRDLLARDQAKDELITDLTDRIEQLEAARG